MKVGSMEHPDFWFIKPHIPYEKPRTKRLRPYLTSLTFTQIVILSHVLADDVNEGYSHLGNLELSSVNGTPTSYCSNPVGIKINNMRQLAKIIKKIMKEGKEQFLNFEFIPHNQYVNTTFPPNPQVRCIERWATARSKHENQDRICTTIPNVYFFK
jgi:hypothetical protein